MFKLRKILDNPPEKKKKKELPELELKIATFLNDISNLNTRQNYESRLRTYFVYFIHNIHPSGKIYKWKELKLEDIWEFRDFLTRKKREDNLAPATLNQIICAVRSFISYYSNRKEAENPFLEVKRKYFFKLPKRQPRYLKEKDVITILSTKVEPKFHIAILLMLYGGLRASEVLEVRKKDFTIVDDVLQLLVKGKGNKERITFITSKSAKNELEKYIDTLSNDDYIFPTRAKINKISWLVKLAKKLREDSGVDFTLHRLRHTFATDLVSKGVQIQYIQKLLGHASVTTTEVYAEARMPDILKKIKEIM